MKWHGLFILLLLGFFMPSDTKAIDPVTIMVLAPVAIKGAEIVTPYVVRGLASGGQHMIGMTGDVVNILRIPWGAGQMLIMDYASGLGNIAQGCIAPFKLTWDAITLPIAFCGIDLSS